MEARAVRKILDDQDINYSIKYDTMIVYGDLILKDISEDISFPHEHLWVRGDVIIENCPSLTNLPVDAIEANVINIKGCASIQNWPKKLYADNIVLLGNAGKQSLFETEIFSDHLTSDHPAHLQDFTNILGYYIQNDDTDKFTSFVLDSAGNPIWRLNSKMAMTLHEMGYLKDIRSSVEIGSYLREIGMIDQYAKLLPIEDAKSVWAAVNQSAEKTSALSFRQ